MQREQCQALKQSATKLRPKEIESTAERQYAELLLRAAWFARHNAAL
jgi:hypothetical protein